MRLRLKEKKKRIRLTRVRLQPESSKRVRLITNSTINGLYNKYLPPHVMTKNGRTERRIDHLIDEARAELTAITLEPSFEFCQRCRSRNIQSIMEERNKMLVTLGEVGKELNIDFDGLWEWQKICEGLIRWVRHKEIEKVVQQEEKKQLRKKKREDKKEKIIRRKLEKESNND